MPPISCVPNIAASGITLWRWRSVMLSLSARYRKLDARIYMIGTCVSSLGVGTGKPEGVWGVRAAINICW
jgi:hypothetical protein